MASSLESEASICGTVAPLSAANTVEVNSWGYISNAEALRPTAEAATQKFRTEPS